MSLSLRAMCAAQAPTILFEDQHLCVLDKPAGLLSQGAQGGEQNLVDWLRVHFGRQYVGLIHRLDRNTSGLMVVAKRSKAAARLSAALRNGLLSRNYLGWICGDLRAPERWVHFLSKDTDQNLMRVVPEGETGGVQAELTATPKERWLTPNGSPLTLVHFTLDTGRSHQIRVQCAARGTPLVGDSKYGHPYAGLILHRPALHSAEISFPHPMSGEILQFTVPLPTDLAALIPDLNTGWRKNASDS